MMIFGNGDTLALGEEVLAEQADDKKERRKHVLSNVEGTKENILCISIICKALLAANCTNFSNYKNLCKSVKSVAEI